MVMIPAMKKAAIPEGRGGCMNMKTGYLCEQTPVFCDLPLPYAGIVRIRFKGSSRIGLSVRNSPSERFG
jgi:hypothetical protein